MNAADSIDGATTSGAADIGAAVGSTEEQSLEAAGSAVPSSVPKDKRQADKIANGAGNVCTALGVDCGNQVGAIDSIDGATTSEAADIGAAVGSTEEQSLEAVGSAVPSSVPKDKRQADKIANGAGAIANAAGAGAVGDVIVSNGDSIDGTLTSDAANAGAQVGSTEEQTLESLGNSVPRRFRA